MEDHNEKNNKLTKSEEIQIGTYRLPTLSQENFTLKQYDTKNVQLFFDNLDLSNNERLSFDYINTQSSYQFPNGAKSGSLVYRALSNNKKSEQPFGLVAANTSEPYVVGPIKIPVYGMFARFSNTYTMRAARSADNFGTINVSWDAWGDWGNLTGWQAEVQVIDLMTSKIVSRKPVNVKTAGSTSISAHSTMDNVRIRIAAKGPYHDGTTKTVFSNQVLFRSESNIFVKVNGTWREGVKTFSKVNGHWQ
jgi:hypothetical protein